MWAGGQGYLSWLKESGVWIGQFCGKCRCGGKSIDFIICPLPGLLLTVCSFGSSAASVIHVLSGTVISSQPSLGWNSFNVMLKSRTWSDIIFYPLTTINVPRSTTLASPGRLLELYNLRLPQIYLIRLGIWIKCSDEWIHIEVWEAVVHSLSEPVSSPSQGKFRWSLYELHQRW